MRGIWIAIENRIYKWNIFINITSYGGGGLVGIIYCTVESVQVAAATVGITIWLTVVDVWVVVITWWP